MQLHESKSLFVGPLPPPEVLIQYNEAVPDAAERILRMAENQSSHRIRQESKVVTSDVWHANLGLIFGFIVAIGGLGAGFFLIKEGMALEGGLFGGGTLGSMVGTFIYGSQQRRKERQKNQEILQGKR